MSGGRPGRARASQPDFVLRLGPGALCRQDPERYFVKGVKASAARELCAGCVHLEACREFAVERPSLQGVWGGTTKGERDSLRRRRREGGERGPPGG